MVRFQSPRSGKFVSDPFADGVLNLGAVLERFNPLDRGNLYLIALREAYRKCLARLFQSPRSGKFVSDVI